jgi:flavin-dependent dehydrogenase
MPNHPDYDVVVVGARCAGAATAMLLARRGARVLILDRARRGSDTLSTHALLRPGVVQLQRWGLLDDLAAAGTPPVCAAAFHYGDDVVRITLRPVLGTQALYAPRRTVLDPLLLDAAESAGAEVSTGVGVTGLRRSGSGRVVGVETGRGVITATTTIGADGMSSLVADRVGAAAAPLATSAGACVYGYVAGHATDGFEWFYGNGMTAGLLPTDGGATLVFVCLPAASRCPSSWPELLRVLREAWPAGGDMTHSGLPTGTLRRFRGAVSYRRAASGPGWALVGDAGYYVDPMSSHGMSQALRDAELLTDALSAADTGTALQRFEARRDALSAPITAAVDDIASFAWDERSVRAPVRALTSAISDEVDVLGELGSPWPGAPAAA